MSINPEELDKEKDVIQMIYGEENVVPANLYCYSSSQKIIDAYSEASGVYVLFHYPEFQKKHKEALSRGVRIRVLTEITKDNLPYIKEALQQYISDIRHMDTITHHFAISEKHYLSCRVVYGNPNLTQCIFSNVGWFVRAQQYLFENMWEKAIPLKQRIRELEEGHKREFVDTIREPADVLKLIPNVVSSAYEEILLLFPNSNTLREFESAGLAESIKNHAQKNSSVRVKLLLKNQQQRFSSQIKRSGTTSNTLVEQNNVEVKFASPDKMDTNTALVIADGEKMVTVEFDEKEEEEVDDYSSSLQPNLTDRIRFATHTNSESAIMSHTSIFERLWIESEMK
jgi:two-component system, OmpR family, sensor histidine kinase VicK